MVRKHIILNFMLLLMLRGNAVIASDPNNNAAPESKSLSYSESEATEIKIWMEKGDTSYQAAKQESDADVKQAFYYEAFCYYQEAAEQGYARAQFLLGVMHDRGKGVTQSYEKAVEWYQKAAEQGNALAQSNLGVMYEEGQGIEQSYAKAIEWYKKAADQGDPGAQYNLGIIYFNDRGGKQSYQEAMKWLQKAADQGYADAQYQLGEIYDRSEAIEQSYEKAAEWYGKAAEQGFSGAQNALGVLYSRGKGVEQSYGKAAEWYRKAAEQEDAEAQYNLGIIYFNGHGMTPSYQEAKKWWQKAADQGYADAQYQLGVLYSKGEGVEQSYEEAVEWYKKAAEQEDAEAQYNLGIIYFNGHGMTPSYQEAKKWWQKAADQGYADAQYQLGVLYSKGEGVKQSYEEAVEWYKKAAEKGLAAAQYSLGVIYDRGEGVEQSYEKAIEWYKKAADQGFSAAQYNLGVMYDNGYGVEQSYEMAAEWCKKAVNYGHPEAQNALGMLYYRGEGVEQSYEKAIEWYKKAADQGFVEAQYSLGVMYDRGEGVEQSYEKAIEWYKIAADQGFAAAQYNLGLMYEEGQGVRVSHKKAVEWYKKAADQGYALAQYNLGLMYERGEGVKLSYKSAVEWWERAVEQGLAAAQYNLGVMYADGIEVEQSYERAIGLWKEAARQEDADALANLGLSYEKGQGVVQSYEKAVEWYRKAAFQGNALVQYKLGLMYAKSQGVLQDEKKSIKWLRQLSNSIEQKTSTEQIDAELYIKVQDRLAFYQNKQDSQRLEDSLSKALYNLKSDRVLDLSTDKNAENKLADEILIECITSELTVRSIKNYIDAAVQKDPSAQLKLGIMYFYGIGVTQDRIRALEWFSEGTQRNNMQAQTRIALSYENGWGTIMSHARALRWYLKKPHNLDLLAAYDFSMIYTEEKDSQESWKCKQHYNLLAHGKAIALKLKGEISDTFNPCSIEELFKAECYAKGSNGLPQDYLKAVEHYVNAVAMGNCLGGYKLGLMCNKGKPLLGWSFKLAKWYYTLAAQGDIEAQYSLAGAYRRGYGVEKNETEAFKWYQRAAKQKHAKAQYQLGNMLYNGKEIVKDIKAALEWYTASADQGYPKANLILGHLYSKDLEVPLDEQRARAYYETAARQGNEESRDILIGLARKKNLQAAAALGSLYADISIERSPATTDSDVFQWLSAAANQGDIKALYRLGRMHEYGWGTPKDDTLAVACFMKAAEKWYGPAQKALAEAYRYGSGIEPSIYKSLRWYRRAARQGDAGASAIIKEIVDKENIPEAVYALAKAHEEGWGIAKDEEEALILYSQAARQGYKKAQYISAIKVLEGKMASDDDLEPLSLLTTLAGREARVKYLELKGKELSRKERKTLKELSEQGYYKAQHKLAELYETGQIIPLNTAKAQENAYLEAIRLYEVALKAVKKDGKLVLMASLDKVRSALRKLKQLGDEDKLEFDHPGFKAFLEFSSSTKKLDPDFRQQLAFVFTQTRGLDTETRAIIDNTLEGLLRFPANSKPSWGVLGMLKAYVKLLGSSSKEQENLSKEIVVSFPYKLSLLHPLWQPIPHPNEVTSKRLKVSTRMLYDPRVEIFNTCFREFEEDYNKDTYEGSVQRILSIFERLHTPEFFGSAAEDLKETSSNLRRLITRDHEPTNRFAHRLVRIADILQKQFEEAKVKRDWDTLRALKETLAHWAVRGQGDCRMGGEDELNRFYIGTLINTKGNDFAALAQEDWTLEMQVAISLAQFRLKLIDALVTEQDNDRIHSVKHLEKKVRLAFGLLGDAENYVDNLEHTVPLKYRQMSSYEIIEVALQKYTPDTMAAHLRDAIDHPHKDINVGKAISYEKIYRRLRFQCLREEIKKKGLASLLSNELFHNEDYLLDHCTREEFTHQALLASSLQQADPNNNSNDKRINIPDWDGLKGMSTMQAKEQLETAFYDDSYTFTPKAAKALLYGMGYIEEE